MPQFTRPHSRRGGRGASCHALKPAFLDQARELQTRFEASFSPCSRRWSWGLPAASHAAASPLSPLSKSISSSVCCTPGTALGCEQQEPSAQGCGAAIPAAGTAAQRSFEMPTPSVQADHSTSVVDLRVPPLRPGQPIPPLDLTLATNERGEVRLHRLSLAALLPPEGARG